MFIVDEQTNWWQHPYTTAGTGLTFFKLWAPLPPSVPPFLLPYLQASLVQLLLLKVKGEEGVGAGLVFLVVQRLHEGVGEGLREGGREGGRQR